MQQFFILIIDRSDFCGAAQEAGCEPPATAVDDSGALAPKERSSLIVSGIPAKRDPNGAGGAANADDGAQEKLVAFGARGPGAAAGAADAEPAAEAAAAVDRDSPAAELRVEDRPHADAESEAQAGADLLII